MPVKTFKNIITLGRNVRLCYIQALPTDVPGFNNLDKERASFKAIDRQH